MRRIQGYIPRNLGGGTFLDGRIQIRNAIEALIVCVIVYLITKILELFLPYLITIAIRLVLWGLLGGICLLGINGEPVSLYALNIINYSNSRTYVTLRPPQREIPADKKKKKDPKEKAFESKKEKKSIKDRIFTKEPKSHGTNNSKPKKEKKQKKSKNNKKSGK